MYDARDQPSVRIAELEEEVRQLRDLLKPRLTFPERWKLTVREGEVLAVLWANYPHWTNRRHLGSAVWRYENRSDKLIDVTLFNLRARVAPLGIRLANTHGRGWMLTSESREIIRRALL
jgi:DNA-binding response OmpR family regulator